jgi:hypothetical protein
MPWVKTGLVDWVNEDFPGYVIVLVGDEYEVLRGGRRSVARSMSGTLRSAWLRPT